MENCTLGRHGLGKVAMNSCMLEGPNDLNRLAILKLKAKYLKEDLGTVPDII